jgi:hypothetical protein
MTTLSTNTRLVLASIVPIFAANVYGYKGPEHTEIGTVARDNYKAYIAANPSKAVGSAAISANWANIAWGLVNEDIPEENCKWHFWNVDGTDDDGIYTFDSAFQRATQLWDEALAQYKLASYTTAYRNLGRVAHLVGDMGVPAHVNLDDHNPYTQSDDWYEGVYAFQGMATSTAIGTGTSLRTIMVTVGEVADDFDSGPIHGIGGVDGEIDAGTRRAGGFSTLTDGPAIASACYPAAIEGVGALYKLFYDTVKPVGSIHKPSEGEIHSGLKGVPLESKFKSYGYQYDQADQMAKVEYFHATKDDAQWPNDFTSCGSVTSRDAQWHFALNWTNSINDEKVWINSVATDKGGCESLTSSSTTLEWCKIDSQRPVVKNTKP